MNSYKLALSLALPLALLTGAFSCSKPAPKTTARTEEAKPTAPPAYFKVDEKTASTISGKVTFHGKRPQLKLLDLTEDPECAKLHHKPVYDQSLVVDRGGDLANAFVYIKSGLEGKQFQPPSTPVTIDQKGCMFEPRVLGIQTGQELKVTNSDPVTHNIHPRAEVNREWNHSQAGGDPPIERRFTKQEVMIRVKCNIHSWMHAWIGVVDNPYFAVTGTDGSFVLKNVPPGNYTIEVWQERLGTQQQHITVAADSKQNLNFEFKDQS
ncbi:MAG: carboxypeptidase regulatory-like domain-containing protein [Bryobacteraceae bacterium]